MQVEASGWLNETQVERVDLRVRLARALAFHNTLGNQSFCTFFFKMTEAKLTETKVPNNL